MRRRSNRIATVGFVALLALGICACAPSDPTSSGPPTTEAHAPSVARTSGDVVPAPGAEGALASPLVTAFVQQHSASPTSAYLRGNGYAIPPKLPAAPRQRVEPPDDPAAVPGPVTTVQCVSGDMHDVITFAAPATGGPVKNYTLSRSADPDGPFDVVASTGTASLSFAAPVTGPGTFYYTVTAAGPGGVGPASEPVDNGRVRMEAGVTPAGATLRSSNGEVVLALPAGAFSRDTTVTVTEVSGSPVGAIVTMAGVYDIEPSGALGAPATLSVSYTLAVTHHQVSDTLLRAAGLMTFRDGIWVSGASNVRAEGGYVSGEVDHFSPWTPGSPSPHGTSGGAVDYCTGVCHDLDTYPGSATRYDTRDPQVCYNCHGSTAEGLPAACGVGENVQEQFFAITGQALPANRSTHPVVAPGAYTSGFYCTLCHDPHAASVSSPELLRAYDPATGLYVQGGGGVAPGDTFCWTCHGPVLNRRVNYFTPGYYTRTGGDKRTAYVGSAHDGLESQTSTTCGACHNEHGAPSAALLNANYAKSTPATVDNDRATGAYAQACLQCHDGSRLAEGAANIKQYVTQDPTNTTGMAYGGHRIKSAGGLLPVDAPLPCTDCHGPHGSLRGNASLLADALGGGFDTSAGAAAVRRFCLACHTTSEGQGWDSAAGAYALVGPSATIEGLRRDGGVLGSGPGGGYNWLRLKVTPGHQLADAASCYDCHGNEYGSADSKNVHSPDSYSVELHTAALTSASITIKGVAYGPYACTTCHDDELAVEHAKTTASSTDAECNACHPTPRNSLGAWDRSGCAQGDCHAGSSLDPMHGTIDADHTTTGPCSASGCHSQSAAAIHGQVGGPGCGACHAIGVTPTLSCGACHATPHMTANHGSADSCASCHQTGNLMRVHGDDCSSCHPTPGSTTTYAGGCSYTGCHPASPQIHTMIPGYSPYHYGDHGEGADCWDCHSVGECQPCHSLSYERQKPVTTANYKTSYRAAAVVNLSAVDMPTAGFSSGVLGTYYQVDGGPVQTGTSIVVMGPATGTRSHSVEYWSVDNHYNTEAHHVIYFSVSAGADTTAPTGTIAVKGGAEYTNSALVTLDNTVTDADTGVVSMRIDPGTGTYGPWIDYSAAAPFTLSSGNGLKTVRAEFRDAFGHVLALSDTIYLDTVAPTGTMYINNNDLATNSLTVTINNNISDAASGMALMQFWNGSTWTALEPYAPTKTITFTGTAQGSRTAQGRFYDNAGNLYTRSDSITYDTIAPTGSMSINNGAANTASVSVQINSAVTDERSGMSQMRFSNDNVNWSGWVAYGATYNWALSAGEGAKTVWAQYADRAGNVVTLADVISYGTSSDVDPPIGSITINGGADWTNTLSATLTLSATDEGGGAVFEMRFSNDNTNWSVWELYDTSKTWSMAGGVGTKTVYVQFRDNSGNVSVGTISDTINVENTWPTGSIIINGGSPYTASQSVTLTLTSSDAGGSGVSSMRFSNDASNWTAWEPVAGTKSWSLTPGAAVKTVYVQYRDGAGNTSSVVSDQIAYLLSYTLTYSAGTGGTISGTSPQTVTYGSAGTGVTAVPNGGYHFLGWSDRIATAARTDTYVTANINATAWFAPDGTHTVTFLTDGSGYTSGQWAQGVPNGGSTTDVTAHPYDDATYDFMYWSNGVSYVYTPTISLTNVTSSQTWTAYFYYTGSCPFLYTWDGTKYVFEADEFAAGYLGLRTSKGYRRPNPIDYHVLATTPAVTGGALEYKLVEERDETDYLDLARLYVVDAPEDRDVYIERSQAEGVGTFTTLDAVIHTTARNLQPPPSVVHMNTGEDVRDKVAVSDRVYAVLNDDRNRNYTYQTLEIDLGDVQDAPQVKLVMDGRTMIPTSPEGRAYSRTFGPQVKFEVQDAAGNWVAVPTSNTILPKPPEFTRPFVLDLSNIWVSESRKVRLTYLYKTYFDSILLDTSADEPVTITELPLQSAVLQPHGFNFKSGIGELYEYVYGAPFGPPRYKLPGNYTKFGDVTPLLGSVDDRFVIFGGGDELTLRFEPPSTSAEGITRRYLFFSNGYYKTLKEDIAHTVEPLPFAAMSNFPYPETESYPTDAEHQAYLSEWNTRYEGP